MDQQVERLDEGALRAIAVLRLRLPDHAIDRILDYVEEHFHRRNLAYWSAVCAAGWTGPRVREFLTRCAQDSRLIVVEAALDAGRGYYANLLKAT
ncbi:hypothetical protein OG874_05820 [Nocardia sp. NBC_00565]|uniref:hypothetical protein n=1 Tax=Nocardia sp. NBC_00565 TaxID=2975993 RepID=UPI002E80A9BA|nr:hypothetical protein [Nocardia sp. NBC_00565]WUC04694.1 hypothetical protein OG874_05820 [Nocardia sp. NBC_00565]